MKFDVTVTVGTGDAFLYTPEQAAQQVIAALGGDPTKDYATVWVSQSEQGSAGTPPPPPAAP